MFCYVIVNFQTRSVRVNHNTEQAHAASRMRDTVVVGIPQHHGRIQLVKDEPPPEVLITDDDL